MQAADIGAASDADDGRATQPDLSRHSDAPEISVGEETEIDDADADADDAGEARSTGCEPPEISITGETELDDGTETFDEDAATSGERSQPADASSVSALVLEPRAVAVQRALYDEPRGRQRPAATRARRRPIGWALGVVAVVSVGFWLSPARQAASESPAAAEPGVPRGAASPPAAVLTAAAATGRATEPISGRAETTDSNVPHVALEMLPIERPPEEAATRVTDEVAKAAGESSRLVAYRLATRAAIQAGSCRHRGDGPGPARISVTFGGDGKVDDVRLGSYAGTPTGECIASKFRALPAAPSINERVGAAVDVHLH